jgi:hypothetical protein
VISVVAVLSFVGRFDAVAVGRPFQRTDKEIGLSITVKGYDGARHNHQSIEIPLALIGPAHFLISLSTKARK